MVRGRLLSSLPPPAVNLQPQLASVTFVTNNPTLTTVALEKPLCMFDGIEPLNGTYHVYLYVMVDSGMGGAAPGLLWWQSGKEGGRVGNFTSTPWAALEGQPGRGWEAGGRHALVTEDLC